MRILSVRRGFEADHGSSSYEFFAPDKLTLEQRAGGLDGRCKLDILALEGDLWLRRRPSHLHRLA